MRLGVDEIKANLNEFRKLRNSEKRYASFDYCYNYFQSFHDSRNITAIASPENLQMSCLQLGFYLASWGMYRGGTNLLTKSVRYIVPVIEEIASTDSTLWQIDADQYTETNIERLLCLASKLRQTMQDGMTKALVTKIMLGVFGNVPAFDTNFRQGCHTTFRAKGLREIGQFYHENAELLDSYREPTLDFMTGESTKRLYTRAKVIDMIFFKEGKL
jgi:hypothetical protein